MKHRFLHLSLGTLVVVAACLVLTSWAQSQKAGSTPSAAISTPRTADGHPDLSGMWNAAGAGRVGTADESGNVNADFPSRRCAPNQRGSGEQTNQTVDAQLTGRMDPNRPLDKPRVWEKVQDLDKNTNTMDPIFKCQPYGVPRMGPPTKIVQTASEVIFLYAAGGGGTQPEGFFIIPTDGRQHHPGRGQEGAFFGHSVAPLERHDHLL